MQRESSSHSLGVWVAGDIPEVGPGIHAASLTLTAPKPAMPSWGLQCSEPLETVEPQWDLYSLQLKGEWSLS